MIDGLVIEFIDKEIQDKVGRFATGSPKWSSAVKFPYMEKSTVVEDIVFEASPNGTGKITPSVIFKPVTFIGNEMHKVSLANYKRFKELKLGKGSKITVSYHNDVLSYVTKLDVPDNDKIKPIPFTKTCPACGGEVRIHKNDKGEATFVYCNNDDCYMKTIGKINNLINQLEIKGIDISTLEKIYNAGYLNEVSDIFNLEYKKISKIEGLGSQSAVNIIDSIREIKPNDYDLIAALGIKNLGKDTAKNILSEFTFKQLLDTDYVSSDDFYKKLLSVDGIAKKMATYTQHGLIDNNELLSVMHNNINYKSLNREKVDKNDQLIFVITGETDPNYFSERKEVKEYIESKGHKLTSAISGKTNYLITEDTTSGTKKNREAQSRGIKIITCSQLVDMLG
jgi:DNA ligase (NAD+)